MIPCPNKNLSEWKELVKELGEDRAFVAYARNGADIPTVEQARELLSPTLNAPGTGAEPDLSAFGQEPPPEDEPTSIKNAAVDAQRAARGMPERVPSAPRGFEHVWSSVLRETAKDQMVGQRLVAELKVKPRPLTDTEDATLLWEQERLQQEQDAAVQAVIDAAEAGDQDKVETAQQRLAKAKDDLYDVYEVGQRSGTESGRGLNARKMAIARDYTLVAIQNRVRASLNGRRLTPEEEKQVSDLHARIAELEKAVAQHDNERAKWEAEKARLKMAAKGAKPKPSKPAGPARKLAALEKQALQDWMQLAETLGAPAVTGTPEERRGQILRTIGASTFAVEPNFRAWKQAMLDKLGEKSRPYLTPELFDESKAYYESLEAEPETKAPQTPEQVLAEYQKHPDPEGFSGLVRGLALAYIVKGNGQSIDTLTNAIVADLDKEGLFPGITPRQVHDAISGYGKASKPSQNQYLKRLRELQTLMRLTSQYEDVMAGKAPLRTGMQRDPMPDEARRLEKLIHEKMKELGIETVNPETQLKSALDRAKTYYRNRIRDIRDQIAKGERTKREKGFVDDDELRALKAEDKALRDVLRKMEGKVGISDEEIAKIIIAALERSIRADEAKLAGTAPPKKEPRQIPDNPDIQDLMDLRKALKEELKKKRQSLPKATRSEAQKIQSEVASLEKSIANLERQIQAGAPPASPKPEKPDTPLIRELRKRQEMLKEIRDDIQDAANPGLSPEEKRNRATNRRIYRELLKVRKKISNRDFSKKERTKIEFDERGEKIQAELERERRKVRIMIEKNRLANRSVPQKMADWLVKWSRFSLISGFNVLGKLATAATGRFITSPLEQAIAAGAGMIPGISQIAERSPRHWGFSSAIEGKAWVDGWINAVKNAPARFKHGVAPWEEVIRERTRKGEFDNLVPSWMDYVGHIHMALKSPAVEREYRASMQYRAAWAVRNGQDITKPGVMMDISNSAYLDALRAKLMQDNALVSGFHAFTRTLEQKGDNAGKIASWVLQMLAPIVKIPTNYVGETATYIGGVPLAGKEIYDAYKNGLDKLTPEEADAIMRHIAKGVLGLGVLAVVGYYLHKYIGGYYHKGEKRDPGDVGAGRLRINDTDLPRFVGHSPVLEALQFGSTVARVEKAVKHHRNAPDEQGTVGQGIMQAAAGISEEVPFGRIAADLMHMANSEGEKTGQRERARFLGSRIVPQGLAEIAEITDRRDGKPVARDAQTVGQGIQTRIPYVRQTGIPLLNIPPVPEKQPKAPSIKLSTPWRRTRY